MASWFCSNLCMTDNQKISEIILVNNKSETAQKYSRALLKSKQIALENGFIMMRKSLYEQQLAKCQKNKTKFRDEEFLPTQKSISENSLDQFPELKNKTIIWKRISEIYPNCELVRDKIEPADIQQGNIGDCYFLSAISALAQNENNIHQIFQKKNATSMIKNEYGIYKLVINVSGEPQQVLIDDYIPVYAKSERPVFCKPVNNQFWVVLLQKAWAKINKSYRNIAYGNPHQVLNRFSVAPVFYFSLTLGLYQDPKAREAQQRFKQNLWEHILQGHKLNFPMCCGSRQKVASQGIKESHSYALLAAYEIEFGKEKVKLLKLRNPWGNTEYMGKFSEYDMVWNTIDLRIKSQIFQKQENDGIFVMPIDQFLLNFESIDICHSRADFNYIYKSVILNDSEPSFYRLFVEKQGQVYITFEKNHVKNPIINQYQAPGVSKILIAEQIEHNKFEFVDCRLQTSLADVTVRCQRLKPGSYVVLVSNDEANNIKQYSFLGNSAKRGTLSAYSNTICAIEQLPNVNNFTFHFFYTHAVKFNKQKKKIGTYQNDWIAKKLIQSSGYGYICISLDQKGTKLFSITIDQNEISKAGFKLQLPPESMKCIKNFDPTQIQLEMTPGQILIFLFKIDFRQTSLTFSFPPPGFDIRRII